MPSDASLKARVEALELQLQKKDEALRGMDKKIAHLETIETERALLACGEHFAQLQDVLGKKKVAYTGGFHDICGRFVNGTRWSAHRFPACTALEKELRAKVVDIDNLSFASKSASSRENIIQNGGHHKLSKEEKDLIAHNEKQKRNKAQSSSGLSRSKSGESSTNVESGVKIIDVGTLTNTGHLLAGNNSCSPTTGMFVQAIVGVNFEAEMDVHIKTAMKKEDIEEVTRLVAKKKKVLQNLACHQRDYKGFCNLPNNLMQVPKGGHEYFFDQSCEWIIVPIMSLERIVEWHYGMGGVLGHVHCRKFYKKRFPGLHQLYTSKHK